MQILRGIRTFTSNAKIKEYWELEPAAMLGVPDIAGNNPELIGSPKTFMVSKGAGGGGTCNCGGLYRKPNSFPLFFLLFIALVARRIRLRVLRQ